MVDYHFDDVIVWQLDPASYVKGASGMLLGPWTSLSGNPVTITQDGKTVQLVRTASDGRASFTADAIAITDGTTKLYSAEWGQGSGDAAVAVEVADDAKARVDALVGPDGLVRPEKVGDLSATYATVEDGSQQVGRVARIAWSAGVTDYTAAVQAACDAVSSAFGLNGRVEFERDRVYPMVGYARVRSNTLIDGQGAKLTKKGVSASSYAFFAALSDGSVGYGSGGQNIKICGFTCEGDFAAGKGACLFAGNHAEQVVIERCRFEQMCVAGHVVDLGGCKDVTVQLCTFAGRLPGSGRAEAVQVDASNDGSLSVADSPGSYDGLPSIGVTVDRCRFEPFTIGATTYPAPFPMGAHSLVQDKWFTDITFSNNIVIDPDDNAASTWQGSVHFVAARRVKIFGNRWVTRRTPVQVRMIGIYAATPAGGTEMRPMDIQIWGNTFDGVTDGQAQVHLEGCDQIKVTDNTGLWVGAGAVPVVEVIGCHRGVISGNDILAGAGTHAKGIYLDTGTTNVKECANQVSGFTTNISQASGLTNELEGQWIPYTPILTRLSDGTVIATTGASGAYMVAGKTVHYQGSLNAAATVDKAYVSLPIPPKVRRTVCGTLIITLGTPPPGQTGVAFMASDMQHLASVNYDTTYNGLTSGQQVQWSCTYEIA